MIWEWRTLKLLALCCKQEALIEAATLLGNQFITREFLHLVDIPLINDAINKFIGQWNNHPLSTQGNLSPNQLWIQGMLNFRNSGYQAVTRVTAIEAGNLAHCRINEGPVPEMQCDFRVVVQCT